MFVNVKNVGFAAELLVPQKTTQKSYIKFMTHFRYCFFFSYRIYIPLRHQTILCVVFIFKKKVIFPTGDKKVAGFFIDSNNLSNFTQ